MSTRSSARLTRWRDSLRHPVVAVGLGLIALQLVLRAWALFPSFFYTDDYLLLLQARRQGLSWSYLLEPYGSHVMPGSRALIWLVDVSGPLNWGVAAAISLVLQLAASAACLWMLVTLFGRRWLVLAPLVIFLTTASTAQATMWWISSINQIPVQIAFFWSVGAWVQYLRMRRVSWLLGTAVAVGTGLLFFQKALLVLPVLVFLAVVYFASGSLPRRVRHLVRTYWPALLVMGALGGTYALYSLSEVPQPFTDREGLDLWRLAWNMFSSAVVAALGGPWRWDWRPGGAWAGTPAWSEVTALIAAVLVALVAVWTRRRAFWGWVLVVGYLGMQVALVATSRAPVFGSEIGLAYRLQTDVVCALVLGIGLAFAPLEGARQSSAPRDRSIRASSRVRRRRAAAIALVALVGVSGTACWAAFAAGWRDQNASKRFVTTLDRDLRRTGEIEIADEALPEPVMPAGFFAPDNRVSTMVELLRRPATFPATSSRIHVVSKNGSVHEGLVGPRADNEPGPQPNCGWLGSTSTLTIPLDRRTFDFNWWVRVAYLSNRDDDVILQAGDTRTPARLTRGLANLYVQADGEIDEVTISRLDDATRICVDVVQVGRLQEGRRQ